MMNEPAMKVTSFRYAEFRPV
jgi:hypothetical protein